MVTLQIIINYILKQKGREMVWKNTEHSYNIRGIHSRKFFKSISV